MRKNIKSLIIIGSFTVVIATVYYSNTIINVLGQNTVSNTVSTTVKTHIEATGIPEVNIYEKIQTPAPASTPVETPTPAPTSTIQPLKEAGIIQKDSENKITAPSDVVAAEVPAKSEEKPQNKVINGNIVLLGDSMTEGLSIYGFLPETHIVGVNSLNTISALEQVDKVVGFNPDKLFILLGINDIWEGGPIDEYINRYKNLITEIKKKTNCTIYIESLLPVSQNAMERNNQISNEIINNANSRIAEMTKELNINYIDVNSGLKDEKGNLRSEYSNDGVHLINTYYHLWTDKLIAYME